jgi:osmoprotectant transport system permease protein
MFEVFGGVVDWFQDPANWEGEEGLTNRLQEHLLLSITAAGVAVLLGLPLAIWLGHVGKGGLLALNVSNIGRAIPTFAILTILSIGPIGTAEFGPYGRAGLATLISLVLFALPPIITNAYVGVREVDPDTVEAARGMGMRGAQLLRRVELPLAMPLIVTGIRLAVVQVWATATIAALVAGPGLGRIITLGFRRQDMAEVLAGSLVVAVFALVLERSMVLLQRYVDPVSRARRASGEAASRAPAVGGPASPGSGGGSAASGLA